MKYMFNENKKVEKKYSVQTVAQAIGKSEGAINAYFSNRDISVKSGIDIDQIVMVIKCKTRGQAINWEEVHELRDRLKDERGIELIPE